MTPYIRAVLLSLSVCLSHPDVLRAQAPPNLDFRGISTEWPAIHLDYRLTCWGAIQYNSDPANFEVYENGRPVTNFTFGVASPTPVCASSVALVFDRSHAMSAQQLQAAKQAGHQFVSRMDGVYDEACVVGFEYDVTLVQPMTTDIALINTAIDALTIQSQTGTSLWDGIYRGFTELADHGINTIKAVVVISGGPDDASTHTPSQIITWAAQRGIRIYTVALGTAPVQNLHIIAGGTGGWDYAPTLARLAQTYDEIFQDVFPCKISYQSSCMNGMDREVELRIRDVCIGTVAQYNYYLPPTDSTTFKDVHISLGKAQVRNGDRVAIPLNVDGLAYGEFLEPAVFTVRIDNPACAIQFDGMRAGPGASLADTSFLWMPHGNHTDIYIQDRAVITDGNPIGEVMFTTGAVMDTCVSTLVLGNWRFLDGCFRPVLTDGELRVNPSIAVVSGSIMTPDSLLWDAQSRAYLPQPAHVSMFALNTGFNDATNARFTISFDSTEFSLISPATYTQAGKPAVIAKSGGMSIAAWDLQAKSRETGGYAEICITASFDNNPDVRSCGRVYVGQTGAIPVCAISMPAIEVDKAGHEYNPMPFVATVTVSNTGGSDADNVWATIATPPDLALSGADAPDVFTKRVAERIPAGAQVNVSWELRHAISPAPVDDLVRVIVTADNAANSTCEGTVSIPAMPNPALSLECEAPTDLQYDEFFHAYVPYPFDVTVRCRNLGAMAAENATARVVLPPNVRLEFPQDSLRKTFTPQTLTSSNPVPATMSWSVRYTAFPHDVEYLAFRFVAGCTDSSRKRVDSAFATCYVAMPPRVPLVITGSTEMCPGDSVTLDAGAGFREYHWTNGDTARRIVVRAPGKFACTMLDIYGRRSFTRTAETTFRTLFPAVSADRDTVLCPGDSLTLYADPGYATYRWNTGAVTRSIIVKDTGRYFCTVEDAGGCTGTSVPLSIVFRPMHPVIAVTGRLPLCRGDSVTLDAGAGYLSYLWSTGERTRTIMTRLPGAYTCRVGDSAACSATTPPVTVVVLEPPSPVIASSAPSPLCAGDTAELDAGAGFARYLWSTGAQTRKIRVTAGGAYHVTVETLDGCPGTSPDVALTFYPTPPTPSIARTGNTLTTPDASPGYAWSRNGAPIPGATRADLVVTQSGSYTVTVISADGCRATSPAFVVDTILSVERLPSRSDLDIWPDPNNGSCLVRMSLDRPGEVVLVVSDILGRTRETWRLTAHTGSNTFTIDMSALPAGSYYLLCRTAGSEVVRMIRRQ